MTSDKKMTALIIMVAVAFLAYLIIPDMNKESVDSRPLTENEIIGKWGDDLEFNGDNTVSAPGDEYITFNWEVCDSANNEVKVSYSVSDDQVDRYYHEVVEENLDDYEDGFILTGEDILYDMADEVRSWGAPSEGIYRFSRTNGTLTLSGDDKYVLTKSGASNRTVRRDYSSAVLPLMVFAAYIIWKVFDSSNDGRTEKTGHYSPYKYERIWEPPAGSAFRNRSGKTDYKDIDRTRHDIFSRILSDDPPRAEYRDGDIVVLNVRFNAHGQTYCYRAKENVYEPGDTVEVKVNGAVKTVTVESVGYYSEDEYPFDTVKLKDIKG